MRVRFYVFYQSKQNQKVKKKQNELCSYIKQKKFIALLEATSI